MSWTTTKRTEAQTKPFYGWWVLSGLFMMYAVSNGISTFTLPLFYPAFMDEFGWNHAEVTRPAAIKFVFASMFNLFVGFLLDRYPPRPIMATGAVLMILGLVNFLFMTELWHFTAVYLFLAFGLSLCGLVPSMVTTSRWFIKYRGRAVGILLMASSFGGAVLPLVIRGQLADGAWRTAVIILAVIGLVGLLLPVIWPVRARPSDKGQTPDGLPVETEQENATPAQLGIAGGATLSEALRMPMFWLLLIATGILWFCITGVVQHQAIYLRQDQGLELSTVALMFSVFFTCSVIGKFVFGWLSDRFERVNIMLLAVLNMMAGLLLLRFVDGTNIQTVYLYAVVYGIGFSGSFTMIQLMVAELFAGPTYGRILGVYVAVDTISGGIGIEALGQIRNSLGSYTPAIDLMIGMTLVSFLCVLGVKQQSAKRRLAAAAA